MRPSLNTLRVQVPNSHILTQNLYYSYHDPKPKYLSIAYLDLLGPSGIENFKAKGLLPRYLEPDFQITGVLGPSGAACSEGPSTLELNSWV